MSKVEKNITTIEVPKPTPNTDSSLNDSLYVNLVKDPGKENKNMTSLSEQSPPQGRLPPLVTKDQSGTPVELTKMAKVGIDNAGFDGNGVVNGSPPDAKVIQPGKDALNGGATKQTDIIELDPDKVDDPGPADDAPAHFDPEQKPLAFCKFIVDHHKLSFGISMGVLCLFLVITAILVVAEYDIFPLEFEDVPLYLTKDDLYLRQQAWIYRNEDPSLLVANTSSAYVGERTSNGDILQVFYQGDNVLTIANLQAIDAFEQELTSKPEWSNYCKATAAGVCLKPISLIRFFDGTYGTTDMTFSDIPGTLYPFSQNQATTDLIQGLLGTGYTLTATEASSSLTRSLIFLGTPLAGYDLTTDSLEDQNKKMRTFEVDNWADLLEDKLDSGINGMEINYFSVQLFFEAIFKQVIFDLLLAVGSMIFIFIFMLFQTGSVWLTSFALFGIYCSFIACNLFYRIILDYRYFGTFHVLSIFIILGIGADNIFVFNDTWRATAHERHAGMTERLSSCYRRATKSMAITSLTTFVAFLSNALSPLLAVSSFGIFSAVLVAFNFLIAITFFPTVLIMYHKHWDTWQWPCCNPCRKWKIYPCASKDPSKSGHRPNLAVRFFKGPYHKAVTHKIGRWIFIIITFAMAVTFIYYATQVKVAEEPLQFYVNGENFQVAPDLNRNGFAKSLDDTNVKVVIAFGLKNQDRSSCHKTDLSCKGRTVWDNSFDLNPKPSQEELLEWCERIRNIPPTEHKNLLLKYDPDTGKVDIECFIVNMNTYMVTEGQNTVFYGTAKDFSLPTSEIKLQDFFNKHTTLYNNTLVYGKLFYRFFETIKSFWLNNGYTQSFTNDYRDFSIMLGETRDQFDTATILSDDILMTEDNVTRYAYYGTRLRYAAFSIKTELIAGTMAFDRGLDLVDAWEAYVDGEVSALPPSLQGGFVLTPDNAFHDFKVKQTLASSALQGIILGVCLAFVVLTLATTNVVIALFATLTIVFVTSTVGGFIDILGWKLSVIESLNLSLVVGLAVDYVVHLSESYHHSLQNDRVLKVRDMLENMGVSVVSGAISTLGASAFMMGAKIQFFMQFGVFIFITIGFSLIYSLCLFTPVLGVIGPTGHFGSLVPPCRWLWYKIIGRKKDDVKCGECKGKGFHGLKNENTDL